LAGDNLQEEQLKRLNYLIRRMHQTADALFFAEVGGSDITPVQMASLRAIQARPGVDQLRLAHAIKLDRNTIAGVVRRLQEKKLIARKQDPKDRRSNLLFVAAAGEELLAELLPAADRAQRRMLNPLKPAERKLLLELIVRVVNQDISKKRDGADRPAAEVRRRRKTVRDQQGVQTRA
jgi:DNA-binding MarR family transcriptional regulator